MTTIFLYIDDDTYYNTEFPYTASEFADEIKIAKTEKQDLLLQEQDGSLFEILHEELDDIKWWIETYD